MLRVPFRLIGVAVGVVLAVGCLAQTEAPPPRTIGYTGWLSGTDGAAVPNGSYTVRVSLYREASGGKALWSETKAVLAAHGVFSTALGDTVPFPSSPDLTFDQALFVGVQIGSDPEMSPRLALQAVPYSLFAHSVADGSITDAKIASVAYAKVTGVPASLPPSGAAAGDLSGAYPAPSVAALQGVPVSPVAPINGQVLAYNAASGRWDPAPPSPSGVTSVAATSPLISSGGQSPCLSLPSASATSDGYLGSDDWTRFNNKVSSISSGPGIAVTGTPTGPSVGVAFGSSAGTAVEGNDIRLSNARTPLPGSTDYIQNNLAGQTADFNISGVGIIGSELGIGLPFPFDRLEVVSQGVGSGIRITGYGKNTAPALSLTLNESPMAALGVAFWPAQFSQDAAMFDAVLGSQHGKLLIQCGDATAPAAMSIGAAGVSIGAAAPHSGARLEVRGDVRLGAEGQWFAASAVENAHILYGLTGGRSFPSGTAQQGWTAERNSLGTYTIHFAPAFGRVPVITATAFNSSNTTLSLDGVTEDSARLSALVGGLPEDVLFHFIAIGPRSPTSAQ